MEIVISIVPIVPDPSLAAAITVTVPLFKAVTSPEASIEARPVLFTIVQFTLLSVAFAGETVALSCSDP